MTEPLTSQPWWLRVVMFLLAAPNVFAGVWAILSPQSWFDDFPGWAPALVAAHPPFNEHLATDAGAGLLASGVVMLIAMIWGRREIVITAAIAYLAFALPHFLFHLFNPADALTTAEDVNGTGSLGIAVVGAVLVLMWQWRRVPAAATTDGSGA